MEKTERIELDIDELPERLYRALLKEWQKTRPNVVYVSDWKVSAVVEWEE